VSGGPGSCGTNAASQVRAGVVAVPQGDIPAAEP
jgi:hypothetical protein